MFMAVDVDSHSDIDRPVGDVAIGADFDHDRVEIHDWIHRIEGTLLPFPQFGDDGVGHLRDQLRDTSTP